MVATAGRVNLGVGSPAWPVAIFYRAFGYDEEARYEVPLVNGLGLAVVRMTKEIV